ncbi:hypothetical protein DOA20_26145 [Salmonella enterica subsp. enterica serovar Newport]|nr:hypothetical protein [Salmonella enterica subsp. enterica serovar Newport]
MLSRLFLCLMLHCALCRHLIQYPARLIVLRVLKFLLELINLLLMVLLVLILLSQSILMGVSISLLILITLLLLQGLIKGVFIPLMAIYLQVRSLNLILHHQFLLPPTINLRTNPITRTGAQRSFLRLRVGALAEVPGISLTLLNPRLTIFLLRLNRRFMLMVISLIINRLLLSRMRKFPKHIDRRLQIYLRLHMP